MRLLKAVLIVFLFFLTVTFCLQNMEEVQIHYYGLIDSFSAPLFTVVLAAVLLGVIIGAIGGMLTNIKLRMELRRQIKEAGGMGKELEASKGEATPKPEFPSFLSSSD
ncbi:MAG: LapA family protein [Deltaproteobacteria bacterium]|nr:LapA family protein [Deltaproteobacteria bacterium]